jgi:hypothetical protein
MGFNCNELKIIHKEKQISYHLLRSFVVEQKARSVNSFLKNIKK